jgi:hypothetical protein
VEQAPSTTRSQEAPSTRVAPSPTQDLEEKGDEAPGSSDSGQPRERAPGAALATAQSRGPEALEALLKQYPRDGKILEALMLAHASRAETLVRSVQTISRLLEVEPEFASDPDVLFILKKGLLGRGEVHAIAFETAMNQMGVEGGELVYQLLNENPKQRDRLKNVLFELRKAGQVSPATAVAYDLRYTTSCRGRLTHLERAEKDGDLRSVNQLQALSTAPKRCGWGKKCQPLCPVEAKRFRQSIDVIQARLDGR